MSKLASDKQKKYLYYLFRVKGFHYDNMRAAHSTRLHIRWKVPEGRKYLTVEEWMKTLESWEASRIIDLLLKFSNMKKRCRQKGKRKHDVPKGSGKRYSGIQGQYKKLQVKGILLKPFYNYAVAVVEKGTCTRHYCMGESEMLTNKWSLVRDSNPVSPDGAELQYNNRPQRSKVSPLPMAGCCRI